ncbi:MAG TPA: NAD(P)/FAD-dependent oxidoreductase [Candidatus Saccharimonadales bacterium]|nr:NAD(P)/FAD-dependent oxidoreductase [Candidatus Saccharimonadales bacterium]
MARKTDVFVIGGGPAGLAAAIAARKKGFDVTVADGGKPPIDKACGEGLMPDAISALADLGIRIQASEGKAFRGIRCISGDSNAAAYFQRGFGIGVRRTVLHQRMIEEAESCGVKLLWETPISGLSSEGILAEGEPTAARWIIGADGGRSLVRRWSGLDAHGSLQSRFAFRRHYRCRPWSDCVEIYWGRQLQAYVSPVGDEETCVVLLTSDPQMRLAAAWREFPELAERLEGTKPVSKERGAVTAMHSLKNVVRGNVALIGDASGSVDAITGEGLRLSFVQAKILAEALEKQDLQRYQAGHRRLARRPTAMGRLMLLLDKRPRLRRQTIRAMAADTRILERLLAVHVGEASPLHLATGGALLGLRLLAV